MPRAGINDEGGTRITRIFDGSRGSLLVALGARRWRVGINEFV